MFWANLHPFGSSSAGVGMSPAPRSRCQRRPSPKGRENQLSDTEPDHARDESTRSLIDTRGQALEQGPVVFVSTCTEATSPQDLFWDVDGLGYIFLNLATLFAVPALEKRGAEGWVRLFFLVNGLITPLFAIAYFYPTFSVPILMLGGVPWAITVPGCLLSLTLFFRRESDPRSGPKTH